LPIEAAIDEDFGVKLIKSRREFNDNVLVKAKASPSKDVLRASFIVKSP